MSNKITPLNGLVNFLIGILTYKFLIDLIVHITGSVNNADNIQKKFIYEFLFGLSILSMVYLLKKYNKTWITDIKYGLYMSSIILIFESVFINWNYLTPDTKLILTGLLLLVIIGGTISNSNN